MAKCVNKTLECVLCMFVQQSNTVVLCQHLGGRHIENGVTVITYKEIFSIGKVNNVISLAISSR